MAALHCWNPEVNHAVLLFSSPFHFRMAMRDSLPSFWQEIWSSSHDSLLLLLSFFFSRIWDLPLQELFFSFWHLCLLCPSSSSLALALEEWEGFLVPSSLSTLGLSEVFIASMMFLEIWLPSVVIFSPTICKFLKTVSYLSDKWILNWWFSDLTYFQSFTVLIISAGHNQYLKSQK